MKWEPGTNYSKEDLKAMQQDAIQRVQEMRRRADHALRGSQPPPSLYGGQRGGAPRPSSSYPHQGSYPSQSQPVQQEPPQAPPAPAAPEPDRQSAAPGPAAHSTAQGTPARGLLGSLTSGLGEGVEHLVEALSGSSNPQQRDTLGKVLEALNLDGERILLLALMLLLYNDGADYALLLAMIYLFI